MQDAVKIAKEIDDCLRREFFLPSYDIHQHMLPAAIIGYFPSALESIANVGHLRQLFAELEKSCSSYRVEQIADYFKIDAVPLKTLWRLADDDRENAILKNVEVAADRAARISNIRRLIEEDFLSVDTYYNRECREFLNETDFLELKLAFIKQWTAKALPTLDALDDEQLTAVISVTRNTLVAARAGSGKTATVVARAVFLVKHCHVDPSEILILAFNKKAAQEIRVRLDNFINPKKAIAGRGEESSRQDQIDDGKSAIPHAMTFHALAHAVVHPDEDILFNAKDSNEQVQTRFVQAMIDERLRSPKHFEEIRKIMMLHFREDWIQIESGGYSLDASELTNFRRSLPRETLRGEYVKSYGEKLIADFLMEHNVPYKYERNHQWNGLNYRPDFTIFRAETKKPSGVIIEYFGLEGDSDYDVMSEEKRKYWLQKADWDFLEYVPGHITAYGKDHFLDMLRTELEGCGIPCKKLSEHEIWMLVKDRAIDRFSKAVTAFISRARKSKVDPNALNILRQSHLAITEAEGAFISVASDIYSDYLIRLNEVGAEDFDGLINRAVSEIKSGNGAFVRRETGSGYISNLKYVFVDEFQDFSALFYDLLCAMQSSCNANVFCVGDDWQAINGFAGSDLKYFRDFETLFAPAVKLSIRTNYRSSKAVVECGNALMNGLGDAALPKNNSEQGSVWLCDISEFNPSPLEQKKYSGDYITPAVSRLALKLLSDGLKVTLLSRTNRLPWYVNYGADIDASGQQGIDRFISMVRGNLSEPLGSNVKISTSHSFKGLQDRAIVILDATRKCYPLIHPDWVFSRILGVSLENCIEEERRIFYVALTRAEFSTYIFSESASISPFLADVTARQRIKSIDWNDLPVISTNAGAIVVRLTSKAGVKIQNEHGRFDKPLYLAKDKIKACGYSYRSIGEPAWEKIFPLTGFSLEKLRSEAWASNADGVEVTILSDINHKLGSYLIDNSEWKGQSKGLADLQQSQADMRDKNSE